MGGLELRFLNSNSGEPLLIRSEEDLDSCWSFARPGGRTPLVAATQAVSGASQRASEKFVIVLTDGVPSDGSFEELRRAVAAKAEGVYFNFMMCTDDEETVERYEGAIDDVPGVDIHDDYESERVQVEQCGNRLSYNKYLAKCVLGARYAKYDNLDDATVQKNNSTATQCPTQSVDGKTTDPGDEGSQYSTVKKDKGRVGRPEKNPACTCSLM